MDPARRFVPAAVALGLAVTMPAGPAHLGVAAVAVLSTWWARVSPRVWWQLAKAPLVFLALGLVPLAFSVTLSPLGIGWSESAGVELLRAGSRSLCALCILLFIACTVPIAELAVVLRRWGCPAVLTDLMVLIPRLVFVSLETLERSKTAALARGGALGWRQRWRSVSALAATLLRRSLTRAERLERGLLARGGDGALRWEASGCAQRNGTVPITLATAVLVGGALWAGGPW